MSQALKQLQLPFDAPPVVAKPGRIHHLQLASGVLGYRLVRAKRRTVALLVDEDGGIEVRAPRYATVPDVEEFVRNRERWIRKRLAEPRPLPFLWESGAQLSWLGQRVTLALREKDDICQLHEGRLEIGLSGGGSPRERALDWMCRQASAFFRGRIEALSRLHGLRVSSVGLSDARTRWGSCGAGGRLLLNWRLMLFPLHIVDYVIAHELAHLRELNHSSRFWDAVGRIYPDYHSARRELSSLARSLPDL